MHDNAADWKGEDWKIECPRSLQCSVLIQAMLDAVRPLDGWDTVWFTLLWYVLIIKGIYFHLANLNTYEAIYCVNNIYFRKLTKGRKLQLWEDVKVANVGLSQLSIADNHKDS